MNKIVMLDILCEMCVCIFFSFCKQNPLVTVCIYMFCKKFPFIKKYIKIAIITLLVIKGTTIGRETR